VRRWLAKGEGFTNYHETAMERGVKRLQWQAGSACPSWSGLARLIVSFGIHRWEAHEHVSTLHKTVAVPKRSTESEAVHKGTLHERHCQKGTLHCIPCARCQHAPLWEIYSGWDVSEDPCRSFGSGRTLASVGSQGTLANALVGS